MTRLILIITSVLLFSGCRQTNTKLQLDKIVFHSSSCFGSCPTYHLQVSNDKKLKLYSEEVYLEDFWPTKDTSKIGYYTGTVNDTTYAKLITELNNIGLDTLDFDGTPYTDGPEITIIVYYNGKRKFMQSSFPKAVTQNLISALYEICETSNLSKTNEKLNIESDNASR